MKKMVIFSFVMSMLILNVGCTVKKAAENENSSNYYKTKNAVTNKNDNLNQSSSKAEDDFEITINQEKVRNLTEKEILKELFMLYLEHYKALPKDDLLKINDFRVEKIDKAENIPDDMKNLEPIYHVNFSVKENRSGSWVSGNGIIKDDGWDVSKLLFARVIKEKTIYRLVIMGTGL